MRPGVQLQGKNILWDAYRSSTKAGADAHALRCSLFGQNHDDKPQGNDTLVLLNNIRRAADGLTEPVAAPKAWEAASAGCSQCGCCNTEARKTIYDISRVSGFSSAEHWQLIGCAEYYSSITIHARSATCRFDGCT
jgi:hypothetical protein